MRLDFETMKNGTLSNWEAATLIKFYETAAILGSAKRKNPGFHFLFAGRQKLNRVLRYMFIMRLLIVRASQLLYRVTPEVVDAISLMRR